MEMNHEYASKGVAGAGLGTGIAGLSLGVLNSLGGLGALSGMFGRPAAQNDASAAMIGALTAGMLSNGSRSTPCGSDCDPVTQREMRLLQELSAEKSKNALRDAVTYTDQKNLEMYRYIDGQIKEIASTLSAQAVQNQATKDSFQLLQERQDCCCQRLETAIQAEAKERRCNDNTIVNYVNQTFYPKEVADVTVGTTMTAQKTYHPLPVFDCGCDCN